MLDVSIITILLIVFVGQASPGPATLSIAATAMGQSRGHGVALAFGVLRCHHKKGAPRSA